MKRSGWFGALLAAVLLIGGAAGATPIYDEGTDGDISTDDTQPTIITAVAGLNEIVLTFGPGDTQNFFEIDLGGSLALTQVVLNGFSTSPANLASLLGNCSPGAGCTAFNAQASERLETAAVGSDLLPGLLGDLGPNETLTNRWVTAESQASTTVSLIFVTTTVPEPSLLGLGLVGLAALTFKRRLADS